MIYIDLETKILHYIDTLQEKDCGTSEHPVSFPNSLPPLPTSGSLQDWKPIDLLYLNILLLADIWSFSGLPFDRCEWKYWLIPHPIVFQQRDSFSCGILIMNYAQLIASGKEWLNQSISSSSVQIMRRKFFLHFVKKGKRKIAEAIGTLEEMPKRGKQKRKKR